MFFLLSGALVSIPLTLFAQQNLNPLLVGLSTVDITLISITIFTPFIEEFSKVFPLIYRHGETQKSIFLLALFVGIGFGIVEFMTYYVTFGASVIVSRIPGLFFHPASTSIAAYGIATKKPLPYFLLAVLLHFLNNIFAVTGSFGLLASIIVTSISIILSWYLHTKTKEEFIETGNAGCSFQ
jgi:RsiW-degrading membrane proteinase PrsW (M82 family)